jgi:hypothetical protein
MDKASDYKELLAIIKEQIQSAQVKTEIAHRSASIQILHVLRGESDKAQYSSQLCSNVLHKCAHPSPASG